MRGEPLKVLILGNGFAGLHLASRLEAMGLTGRALEVTLVGRRPDCTLTPLLVDVLTGVLPPERCLKAVAPMVPRTAFVLGEVESLSLKARRVAVRVDGDRRVLSYDHLVIALGGVPETLALPGLERAYTFWTLSDAVALRDRVRDELHDHPEAPPRFAVVGGGLLGIEVAGELAGMLEREAPGPAPALSLVSATDRLLPAQGAAMAEHVTASLTRRGVDIYLNGRVEAVEQGALRLAGGMRIPADVVVLATGVRPSPLAAELPLPHDRLGRLMVRPTLQTVTRPEVWALGDNAAVPGPDGLAPALAQHAVRQAEHLARNFAALVAGACLAPYDYRTLGVMATLGPREAVAEVQGWTVWGEAVWWARRAYYAWALPQPATRLGLMADWAAQALQPPWHLPRLIDGWRPPQLGPAGVSGDFSVTWLPGPAGAPRGLGAPRDTTTEVD